MKRTLLKFLTFLVGAVISLDCLGQTDPRNIEELYVELDSLFSEDEDNLDLFALADSLLAIEDARMSALFLRAGYVSEIVTAGRSLGMSQYGFTPGISYFHSSGFFTGVTGYSSTAYEPAYYLTDLTIGYLYSFKDKLNLQLSHSFYVYNDTLRNHPFNKAIQSSISYKHKRIETGFNYAYLYGSDRAHRFTVQTNFRMKFSLKGWVDALTVMPGIAAQWGNADVYYWRQPRTALTDLYRIVIDDGYPRLSRRDFRRLFYLLETDREPAGRYFLTQRNYSDDEAESLLERYDKNQVTPENTFGFMNFSASIPVIIRAGAFSLLLNYTYNLPQSLPGENYSYPPSGFFSSSLAYTISWIKK